MTLLEQSKAPSMHPCDVLGDIIIKGNNIPTKIFQLALTGLLQNVSILSNCYYFIRPKLPSQTLFYAILHKG